MTAQPLAALSDHALERAVLGALITHGEAWPRVAGTLRPEHFTDPAGQGLFKIIRSVAERDGRVNIMAVRAALELDDNGGSGWRDNAIMALHDAAPLSPEDVDGLASSLVEVWARRRTAEIGAWMASEAKRAYASPFDLTRDVALCLEEIISTGRSARTTSATFGETARACLARLENELATGTSVSTGLVDLDKVLGGYVPGRLIILAGRPGMGKSTAGPSSARQVARDGNGVFLCSLEMTKEEMTNRLLTDAAWTRDQAIAYKRLEAKELEPHELARIAGIVPKVDELPLVIDDQANLTVDELQGRVRRAGQAMERNGHHMSLVLVDHLQLLKQDDRLVDKPHRAIGENARRLKNMAKELGVCVVALCQLNRGVEGREEKRPTKADLRQSGEIEEHADQVVLVYREAAYLAKQTEKDQTKEAQRLQRLAETTHRMELIVDKNRHGPEAIVKVWADMPSCAVRNASFGGWQ